MQTVIIAIHLMIVVALVAVVLLQRSEGGALGVGGGSGFMTGRGQANVLTRATAILAALFFATSLSLTLIARYGHGNRLDFDAVRRGTAEPAARLPPTQPNSVLDQVRAIQQQRASGGSVSAPAETAPAQPAATVPATATPAAAGAGTTTPPALHRGAGTAAEPSGMPSRAAPANPAQAPSTPQPTAK
jgi:preprotein translocase subunit SecG